MRNFSLDILSEFLKLFSSSSIERSCFILCSMENFANYFKNSFKTFFCNLPRSSRVFTCHAFFSYVMKFHFKHSLLNLIISIECKVPQFLVSFLLFIKFVQYDFIITLRTKTILVGGGLPIILSHNYLRDLFL